MKSIPIALQTYIDADATTLCYLCKVTTKGGTVYGFTNLDAPVTYDDGTGSLVYAADNGFTPERLQATADLAVDNTEIQGWVADTGITEAQIRAGLFDFAKIIVYRVNYLDLTAGHEIIVSGTAGETIFTELGWKTEFRSLTQQTKQPISKLYSITCRARFGSQPIGTGGGVPEEKFPCTKAFTWVSGTVTAVDATEPDRIFTCSTLTQADAYFVPGVVQWLTGNNAGAQMEVDVFAAGVVSHTLALAYVVAIGDTFQIRQDCNKVALTVGTVQGDCKDKHNNLLNFRGEHLIRPADAATLMVPGANNNRVGT